MPSKSSYGQLYCILNIGLETYAVSPKLEPQISQALTLYLILGVNFDKAWEATLELHSILNANVSESGWEEEPCIEEYLMYLVQLAIWGLRGHALYAILIIRLI